MKVSKIRLLASFATLLFATGANAQAADSAQNSGQGMMQPGMMSSGLLMPSMDARRGRDLFASKGCIVCHSINGVGGEDAPQLDATTMHMPMNPFEFAAKMWDGAQAMVEMQEEELGAQIQLSGQDLADIIAFVHDPKAQQGFSEADIPENIKEIMEHEEDDESGDEEDSSHSN